MRTKFIIAASLVLALSVLDILTGAENISVADAVAGNSFHREILLSFRLPKLLAALLAGAALSVSGLVMQTVFRNPLAGPYMLGVSAGASLGVALFMMAAPIIGAGLFATVGVAASAWIGSAAVLFVVMLVSLKLRDIMAVLILGMMIGSATSAFVDILQFFSNESALKGFVLWSMGSLGGLSWVQLCVMAACTFAGLAMAMSSMRVLDILLLGENYAVTMGVDVMKSRLLLFSATALMAGGVTAFCGPVAFIGLAAPHVARMVWKRAPHRILLPASVLAGVVMTVLCDILSSMTVTGYPLPLNTVAALFGIPVVVMVVWNGAGSHRLM